MSEVYQIRPDRPQHQVISTKPESIAVFQQCTSADRELMTRVMTLEASLGSFRNYLCCYWMPGFYEIGQSTVTFLYEIVIIYNVPFQMLSKKILH